MPKYSIQQLQNLLKDKELSKSERKRYIQALYRKKNPEKMKIVNKKWNSQNKEKMLRSVKNKERVAVTEKNYRIKNKHKIREWKRRRRGLEEKTLENSKTSDLILEWELSWRNKDITCPYCLKKTSPKYTHIDHFFPLSKGGLHEIYNLVACCGDCNLHKSDKNPFDFIKELAHKASIEECDI